MPNKRDNSPLIRCDDVNDLAMCTLSVCMNQLIQYQFINIYIYIYNAINIAYIDDQ